MVLFWNLLLIQRFEYLYELVTKLWASLRERAFNYCSRKRAFNYCSRKRGAFNYCSRKRAFNYCSRKRALNSCSCKIRYDHTRLSH